MPKHRWRESIKSFFGSHIDPDKDEELQESKAEMEDRVQKILKLLREDGERDGNEPLANMIEDFRRHYESLYTRYGHLTGELRKRIHGKHGKDTSSSSSSSDSDSDHSPSKKGSKNGKIGNDFEKVVDDYKLELEAATLEVADLKRKLVVAIGEKEASDLEYQGALDKIQASEKIIKDLNLESERWSEKKLKLLGENEELNRRLQAAGKLEAELNQKLADINSEKDNLILEKEATISRIEEGNKIAEDLRSYSSLLKDEKEALQLDLEATKEKLSRVEEKLESSQMQVAELSSMLRAAEQENSSHSLKILQLLDEIKQLQHKLADHVTESSQLRDKLDEKAKEILAHETHKSEVSVHVRGLETELDLLRTQREEIEKQKEGELSDMLKKLEDKEKDSSSQLEDLTAKIKDMQVEIDTSLSQKSELEEELSRKSNEASATIKDLTDQINEKQQILDSLSIEKVELGRQLERRTQEVSESLNQMDALKEELASKSADQQKMLEEKETSMSQVKNLELEVSSLLLLKDEMEDQLRSKSKEITQLHGEKEIIQTKISEMERIISEKESKVSSLQKRLEDGEIEASARFAALTEQVNNLQEQLNSLSALKIESDALLEKKTAEIVEYANQVDNLKEELASKLVDGQRLLGEKDGLLVQINDLELVVESLCNHKSEMEGHINSKVDESNRLSEENKHLQSKISELEKVLTERMDELFAIQKILDDANIEASTQIDALNEQVKNLRQERDSLQSEKSQVELQMERRIEDFSANLAQTEDQKSELANQVANQYRKLKEEEDAFHKLSDEYKQLELLFEKCKENLRVTEIKMTEIVEESQKNYESKNQTVNELEEVIEDLKGELEMKGDEISTLVENVRTLEVKLRLANQKIRVTEQLLTENEESYKSKEEKLHNEQALLEERIATLTGLVAAHKEAQLRLMRDAPEKVNDVMIEMDTFNMKFEEDYGHLESRIYEILNEFKVTMNWIKEANGEKEKLRKEISIIVKQLRDEKEHGLVLTEKVGDMEKSLQKGKDEKISLVKSLKGLEEKLGQLEKVVKEKDEMLGELEQMIKSKDDGILELGEEKREAIRQLCIWIEYHRNRYDDLKEMISKTTTARRQITA